MSLPDQRVIERRAGVARQRCFYRSHCFQFLQLFFFRTELWFRDTSIFTGIRIQIVWIIPTPSHQTQTERRCRAIDKCYSVCRLHREIRSSWGVSTHGSVCDEQRGISDKYYKLWITQQSWCVLYLTSNIPGKNKYIKLVKCTSVSKVSVNVWRRLPSSGSCNRFVSDQLEWPISYIHY